MQSVEGATLGAKTASTFSIFLIFLRLGLTSFGGPIAHLGYFREAFVTRRKWLTEESYADLVALCQFLPGPASSQVGLALGLSRGGYAGAAAAWLGFTLPSAAALILFAQGITHYGSVLPAEALHGLKVVAVAGSGGLLCLLAIFAPSFMLVAGVLPYWEHLRRNHRIQAALRGVLGWFLGAMK